MFEGEPIAANVGSGGEQLGEHSAKAALPRPAAFQRQHSPRLLDHRPCGMDALSPQQSVPDAQKSNTADDDSSKAKRAHQACLNCRKRKSRCLL